MSKQRNSGVVSSVLSIILLPVLMLISASAPAETYYFHNDHLGTPQVVTDQNQEVVWKGEYDPFGKVTETVVLVEQNLRFPGQYFDVETGLHYNYFRSYDPGTGRYVESDPIGLEGGLNIYSYVIGNPLSYSDRLGLDVDVCFFPNAAAGFGHVGIGVNSNNNTEGFYPSGSNPISTPGEVRLDVGERECTTLESNEEEDECIQQCIDRRRNDPGRYRLMSRQCTSFVRDCLRECEIHDGNYNGPRPNPFYRQLVNG